MTDKKKDLLNPLSGLAETTRPIKSIPKSTERRKKELDNPLSTLATTEVRRAINPQGKDTTMAGRYRRRSILIEPKMDEVITRKAQELSVGKMELVRYLLAAGLAHLNSGEAPTKKKVVAIKLEMPDWQGR